MIGPHRVMVRRSAYADLPAGVLSPILRLLSLRQKLKCQGVCRAWQQLLHGAGSVNTSACVRDIWGTKLELTIRGSLRVREKTLLDELFEKPAEPPSIVLSSAAACQTLEDKGFFAWFDRLAPSLQVIHLRFEDIHLGTAVPRCFRGGWVFAHILATLHFASEPGECGPQLHVDAGGHTDMPSTASVKFAI